MSGYGFQAKVALAANKFPDGIILNELCCNLDVKALVVLGPPRGSFARIQVQGAG